MNSFTITKNIFVNASPEVVFDALTSSAKIVKYYPLHSVISDWQVGGDVHYKGEVDGQEFIDYGVITELSSPCRYMYSYWSDNHGTEKTPQNHLGISYSLTVENNGTQIELMQTNIRSEEMFRMMDTVVWGALLTSLKQYVESGTEKDKQTSSVNI